MRLCQRGWDLLEPDPMESGAFGSFPTGEQHVVKPRAAQSVLAWDDHHHWRSLCLVLEARLADGRRSIAQPTTIPHDSLPRV
jgi:hypothetical protein